jgi:hypothetical protein
MNKIHHVAESKAHDFLAGVGKTKIRKIHFSHIIQSLHAPFSPLISMMKHF